MDNILVTGGAGFIGSNLCKKLLTLGYNVYVIDNFNNFYNPEIKRQNISDIVELSAVTGAKFCVYEGDICDIGFLKCVFDSNKFDLIIHLAAYAGVRPSIENPTKYIEVNINGTANMLEMAETFKVKSFIFASSSSVYGNNKNICFSESDNTDFPISPYAATKKAGELLCYTYHRLFDISIAVLRFFTVYGPGQRPDLAIYKFTKLIFEDKKVPVFGDGSTERDYTYIDDIISGIIASSCHIKNVYTYGIFNLGNSKTISLNEMVSRLEATIGKKADIIRCEPQSGDVERTFADISKARKMLGFDPQTSFNEGINKFVSWYKDKFISLNCL